MHDIGVLEARQYAGLFQKVRTRDIKALVGERVRRHHRAVASPAAEREKLLDRDGALKPQIGAQIGDAEAALPQHLDDAERPAAQHGADRQRVEHFPVLRRVQRRATRLADGGRAGVDIVANRAVHGLALD